MDTQISTDANALYPVHNHKIHLTSYIFICALSENKKKKPFPNLICDNINFMLKLFVYEKTKNKKKIKK